MIRRFTVFLVFVILLGMSAAVADSIWNKDAASPYGTDKVYKVGDIVNIIILESATAQNKAGTKADIKDDLGVKFTNTIQSLSPFVGSSNQAGGQFYNKYKGLGQTTRSSSVQARIAAWVADVLPNGNLSVKGKHRVTVNDEVQEITITGIVRPKDISGMNTVYSYQIANADVILQGTGDVASIASPGIFTRILNWLF